MSFIYHFLTPEGPTACGDKDAKVGYHTWPQVTCPKCLAVHNGTALPDEDLSTIVVEQPPPEATKESIKKSPAYSDDDPIKFGKYRGERLGDVPASYLHWLWTQRPISDKRLENYIYNNITALKKEYPDGIWT